MIKFDNQAFIDFFNDNFKLSVAIVVIGALFLFVTAAPALVMMIIASTLMAFLLAGLGVLLWRVIKARNNFNLYDFFGIPRPEERESPKAGANLQEVNSSEKPTAE